MPKRIAFFLPHFGHGGAEGVVLRLLRGVDRARFAPILILQRRRGELLELVPPDIPILALRHSRLPGCVPELARIYSLNRVQLAVTVTNATNLYSVVASQLAKTGVRTLITEHTPLRAFLTETRFPRLRQAAIRQIYSRATLTGGPLELIGEDFATVLGAAAPPFVTLPNPVVDHVGPLRQLPDYAHHIVSVGRLAPEKRFDLLIESLAELRKDVPEIHLTIHGEGPERPALEALIRERELSELVRLPGYTADLDAAYHSADLFVCTSRREGLGNAIIEAMARGVPVVSVDCPFGPRHLLQNGGAGKLVESDTPAEIAKAITELLGDRALRQRYIQAAFDVAQLYQVNQAVEVYQAAFDRSLALPDRLAKIVCG